MLRYGLAFIGRSRKTGYTPSQLASRGIARMSPQLQNVSEVIKQVRRRIRTRQALRGAAITLAVAAASLLIVALVAGLLKQRHAALIVLRLVPVILTMAAAWLFVIRPLRAKINDAKIARLIEE